LLRNFESHLKDRSYAPSWQKEAPSPDLLQYYGENFKISFVDNNIKSFIDELHQQCEADPRIKVRLLQQLSANQRLYKRVREAIKVQDLKSALDMLDQHFIDTEDADNLNVVYLFLGRLNRLRERTHLHVLTREEAQVGRNKLAMDILDFLDQTTL
ncbi:MAG: hypothetical protein AAFP02_01195, partial [Bacteroidota bacterium]